MSQVDFRLLTKLLTKKREEKKDKAIEEKKEGVANKIMRGHEWKITLKKCPK